MFTALSAWLFSRHNTVDAADCCGMSGDERGRQQCFLVVILCLYKSVLRAVSVVFLSHYVTSICFCDHQL